MADGRTERVSVGPGTIESDDWATSVAIPGDGQFVAFFTAAANLVPNDTDGKWDAYVHVTAP